MTPAVRIKGLKRKKIGDVLQAVAVAEYLQEAPVALDPKRIASFLERQPLSPPPQSGLLKLWFSESMACIVRPVVGSAGLAIQIARKRVETRLL